MGTQEVGERQWGHIVTPMHREDSHVPMAAEFGMIQTNGVLKSSDATQSWSRQEELLKKAWPV